MTTHIIEDLADEVVRVIVDKLRLEREQHERVVRSSGHRSREAPRHAPLADQDLVRLPMDLQTLERRAIEAALRVTNGENARAAALLGIHRGTLFRKRKAYGV